MSKKRIINFDLPSAEELFRDDHKHDEFWNKFLGISDKCDSNEKKDEAEQDGREDRKEDDKLL